jgi:hypothetical protein
LDTASDPLHRRAVIGCFGKLALERAEGRSASTEVVVDAFDVAESAKLPR